MQLTERHFVNKNHENYKEIDELSFKSKNLYNRALYLQNEHFKLKQVYLNYNEKFINLHNTSYW